MSNVIEFPMDRVRLTADAIVQQSIDLEEETERMLAQAKAIEEQSQRVLNYLSNLEN